MTKRRRISIATPHYTVAINGRPQLEKLTLNEAAELLARNEVKLDAKHLTRELWQGITFRNEFGFTCSVFDQLSASYPNEEPPTHMTESEFYDYEQAQAAERQKDFETRISQVGG